MGIKTFNIDEEIYKAFSAHCKKNGMSMSKKIENFIREEIEKLTPKMNEINKMQERKIEPVKQNITSEHHTFSRYC